MNIIRKLLLMQAFLMFALLPKAGFSQTNLADELFANFEYQATIDFYSKIKIDENDLKSLKQLALSYYYIHDYKNAEQQLKKLLPNAEENPETFLYYAISLKNNGKFDEAKKYLNSYSKFNKEAASIISNSIDSMKFWKTLEPKYNVYELKGINNTGADFSPTKYNNSIIYASENTAMPESGLQISGYSENVKGLNYGMEIDPTVKYFMATVNVEDKSLNVANSKNINSENNPVLRNNTICFDSLNSVVYFTKISIYENPTLATHSAIYMAKINNDKIETPQPIVFHDTLMKYNFGHPFITKDGNEMYFCADLPGGFGGYDIYKSKKTNKKWGQPENLGKNINGNGNEMFPFYKDGKLFFASNSFAGYGGLDVFVSTENSGAWEKSMNLREPVNSSADDFGLMYFDKRNGFLCSNRYGGKGDDDIYSFNEIFVPKPVEEPIVEEKPIDSFYIIKDLRFDNVLFDFNSFELSAYFQHQLDSLVEILKERDTTQIGLYGFADPKGNSDYNMNLSSSRAVEVYKYLMWKGVDSKRIVIKAKGESLVKVNCETDSCIEAQNALSRRVEIVFNPKESLIGQSKTLINFEGDKFKLDKNLKIKIDEILGQIQSDSNLKVMLMGCADSNNTLMITYKRVAAIQEYLVKKSIQENRIDHEIFIKMESIEPEKLNSIELNLLKN